MALRRSWSGPQVRSGEEGQFIVIHEVGPLRPELWGLVARDLPA